MTTHSEVPIRIEPLPTPEPGENAAGDPLAAPREASSRAIGDPEIGGPEIGGRDGPEPTRFGDWELRGRCIDF